MFRVGSTFSEMEIFDACRVEGSDFGDQVVDEPSGVVRGECVGWVDKGVSSFLTEATSRLERG